MTVDGKVATDTMVLDDVAEALRRVAVGQERVVVSEHGVPVAAVIPLEDLRLLEILEKEELERIDLEKIRMRQADPDYHETIPWKQVKAELGL